jgi:S1-C subfamily serine protease
LSVVSLTRGANAAPDPAACRALEDRTETAAKAHDWPRLLKNGEQLLRDCGALNDTIKGAAYTAIAEAQLRSGKLDEALTAARACGALGSGGPFYFDCRFLEADALDGLGRIPEERSMLTAILDGLPPGRKDSKLRKAVEAALSNIDPEAGKPGHKTKRRSIDRGEPRGTRIYGTGFVISRDGYIVTNRHVIASCGPIHTADGQSLSLIRADQTRDLALLKSSTAFSQVASLRAEGAKIGEPVVVYGFPLPGLLASSGNLTTGIVSAEAGLRDSHRTFQISAPVQPGNSGGPVLDERGRVIGVVVAKLEALPMLSGTELPQNVNFAVAETELTGFLHEAGVSPQIGGDLPKLDVAAIAAGAKAYVVQIVCTPTG